MIRNILLILFLTALIVPSYAKMVGVYGNTFPIVEEDFLTFIHDRLEAMKASGQLSSLNKAFVKRVKAHVLRPTPVDGLSTTNKTQSYYFDPTFVLQKTISDAKGHVLYPIGTRVNPLDHVSMHIVLLFIDADDARQIQWANDEAKKYDRVEVILVKGNIIDARHALHQRIFFDQSGYLTTKLGIRYIPSRVLEHKEKANNKSKKMLEITSFACEKGEKICAEK